MDTMAHMVPQAIPLSHDCGCHYDHIDKGNM